MEMGTGHPDFLGDGGKVGFEVGKTGGMAALICKGSSCREYDEVFATPVRKRFRVPPLQVQVDAFVAS